MAHVEHSSRGFGRDRHDAGRDSHTERSNADRGTDSKDTCADRRDS